MIDTKYQFFDDLSDGEYQSLKSSIETHGVLVPVEYDDAGNVLDGHHRLKACAELGITIWERLIRKGLSEADKKNHVRTLNIVRRQLTNEQRKKCWAEMRQDGMTLSAIAAADGTVSINTVKSAIDNSTLQNCKVEPTKVIGKDGKARPTKYAKTPKPEHIYIHENDAKKIFALPEKQQAIVFNGDKTLPEIKSEIKKEIIKKRKESIEITLKSEIKNIPKIQCTSANDFLSSVEDSSIDLLITDPPYSTDVDDIVAFAQSWLPEALKKVKDTGFAFVFIGAYPEEIIAYMNTKIPTQMLVWEYKNTLGQNPKERYKLNYQSILFYRMKNSGDLNIDLTSEQWAVQSINAPDGRLGDRYHEWQKPIELAERLIRHTTNEGASIIDPFCCTGTFLLAAAKLNRIANGCDISKENLEIAVKRGCEYAR